MAGWGECGIAGGGCQLDRSQPLCRVSPECQRLCSSRQPVHCSSEQQKIEQHSGHFNEVCGTKKTVRGSCGELNTSQYSRDQTHQTHQTQGRQAANSNGSRKSDIEQGRGEAVRPSPVPSHSPHLSHSPSSTQPSLGSLYLQQLKQPPSVLRSLQNPF